MSAFSSAEFVLKWCIDLRPRVVRPIGLIQGKPERWTLHAAARATTGTFTLALTVEVDASREAAKSVDVADTS